MNLYEKIEQDIKTSMKEKDTVRRGILVLLKSAIINKAIDKQVDRDQLTNEELEAIIAMEVKKRRDVAVQYRTANREDKAQEEENEVVILLPYLPPQLTKEDIDTLVEEVIEGVDVYDKKSFGKVMSVVSSKTKGRADSFLVVKIVKEKLSRYNRPAS